MTEQTERNPSLYHTTITWLDSSATTYATPAAPRCANAWLALLFDDNTELHVRVEAVRTIAYAPPTRHAEEA